MKKFFVLVKKEIKELVTPQMFLPLIAMVLIFSFIGNLMSKETAKITAPQSVWILDQDKTETSEKIAEILNQAQFKVSVLRDKEAKGVIEETKKNNIPFFLVLPTGFEQGIKEFKLQEIPVYKVVRSFSLISGAKYDVADRVVGMINNYFSNEWIKEKNINIPPDLLKSPVKKNEFVIINEEQANVNLALIKNFITQQTAFIPIILFFVIVIASQMVAMTVANEKENKTLETLLSSPIDRKTIVFAKLIGAGIVALLSAGFYMIGFRYYLRGFMGSAATGSISPELTEALKTLGITIGPVEYIFLGLSLFLGILVALSIAMILGTLTDSAKNVQSVTTPLMVLVMVPYFLTLFLDINAISPIFRYIIYAIPFTHPFLAIQKLMTHDYLFVILGIIYELVVFIIFVVLAAKIFSSDKIITLKLSFRKKRKTAV